MPERRMGFYRDFRVYSGGHGKVFHYFEHALALGWDARVYLTPESLRDASNPWLRYPDRICASWQPDRFDRLLLGGLDWSALPPDTALPPVINLVQGVIHADPGDPRFAFLDRPALRIAVSHEVGAAIARTGRVNGPIHVVPAALSLPSRAWPKQAAARVFIAAMKAPELGQALAARLGAAGLDIELAVEQRPREPFLEALARAEIAVCLPHDREGFYLPGLEAMALGTIPISTDCIGNREYLRHGENAWLATADPQPLADAVLQLAADPLLRQRLRAAGERTASQFNLCSERERFAQLLAGLDLPP